MRSARRKPQAPGREAPDVGDSATSDYGKTASFLAVGVGLTGIITYTYFFIASHVLSKPDYGQITVLWSAVFITVSTLYRPIEQLLSRHISERLVTAEPIGEPMRVAAKIQLGLTALFAALALALRGPLQNGLLEGNEALYWVFFSSVVFYAASYFARGFLAGNRRFGLFAALILSESVLSHPLRGPRRGQPAERRVGGGDRDRRRPQPQPDGRPPRLRPPGPARAGPDLGP